MIKDILAFKITNLLIFSFLVYLASFAIPTGALFLVLSFASVSIGIFEISIIFMITFLSTVLGDITTYLFARLFSNKAMKLIKSVKSLDKSQNKVHRFFEKNGFCTIVLSRFVFSGLGPVVNYYSALIKYDFKKFLLATLLGEFFYAAIYTTIGVIFKDFITELLNLINGIFIVLALVFAIVFVLKKIKKEIKREKIVI